MEKIQTFLHVILLFGLGLGYNLEERLPLFKQGPAGSTFGYSGVLHKLSNKSDATLSESLIVVGAPTADRLSNQLNTEKPGGLFSCPLTTSMKDCNRVNIDNEEGSTKRYNKTGQWLGVSVKSKGPGKNLITCAHKFHGAVNRDIRELENLCGKCFLLDGTVATLDDAADDGFIASPCDKKDNYGIWDKFEYSYAQTGTSLAVLDDEYIAGGPGTWAWSGALFDIYQVDAGFSGLFAEYKLYESGGCYRQGKSREGYSATKCQKIPLRRDSYLGFSVTVSKTMKGPNGGTVYIAGAPKGNYTGAVVLYQKDPVFQLELQTVDVLMGEKIGSSFGFSVASIDINGDGWDDLLVGAPQFYRNTQKEKYGGAVYVYLNNQNGSFANVEPQMLYGVSDSFFGWSIAPIGDLDQDGYNDVAIGAPYHNPSGKVFIFRGGKDGILTLAQSFDGTNFKPNPGLPGKVKAFGLSLSGNVDIDNNNYPDLLIGTSSDFVVLLRSRPVITMKKGLFVEPGEIDLKNSSCAMQGPSNACFQVKVCYSYEARHGETSGNLEIFYKLVFDSKKVAAGKAPRTTTADGMHIIERDATINGSGSEFQCETSHTVFFLDSAKDRINPIDVHFEIGLQSDRQKVVRQRPGDDVYDMLQIPIMDADYEKEETKSVTISSNCGDDGCQSNLQISAETVPEIIAGLDEEIALTIVATNDAEEAHQSFIRVNLPPSVTYINASLPKNPDRSISCRDSLARDASFSYVECEIGNPFEGEETIQILINVKEIYADIETIQFNVTASTSSENPIIRTLPVEAKVIIEYNLEISGTQRPQQIRYPMTPNDLTIRGESSIKFVGDIGPELDYNFNIRNLGKRPATDVSLMVDFPFEIYNGKWLLYLFSASPTRGQLPVGQCETKNDYINPLEMSLKTADFNRIRSKRELRHQERIAGLVVPKAKQRRSGGSVITLDCKTNICQRIVCTLDEIPGGATIAVKFVSHVWEATFLEEFITTDLIFLKTAGELMSERSNVRIVGTSTAEISTTLDHYEVQVENIYTFPWWYILIAVILALILYLLIIFVMYTCGFFKRNRKHRERTITPEPERVDESTGV